MKIIQQTSQQLILQEQLWGLWLLGILIALIGLGIIVALQPPIYLLGACCIAIARFLEILAPVETCIFDKNQNQMLLKQDRWLSRQVNSYNIDAISKVKVEEVTFWGTQFYSISLFLTTGKRLCLTQFPTTDCELQQKLASTIRRFLRSP